MLLNRSSARLLEASQVVAHRRPPIQEFAYTDKGLATLGSMRRSGNFNISSPSPSFCAPGSCRSFTSDMDESADEKRRPPPSAEFVEPPTELVEGCFERPTPVLFVAGEGRSAKWWGPIAWYFSQRGCTVGTMELRGRGLTCTNELALKALQSGVAKTVESSGLPPPVIVAHSVGGFVCQQYLQSYSAAGLVLLDPFPPSPSELAKRLLARALLSANKSQHIVYPEQIANGIKASPGQWEHVLRHYFAEVHRNDPWMHPSSLGDEIPTSPVDRNAYSSTHFPAKSFAQMCTDAPTSKVRLERHVVETLILGSDFLSNSEKGREEPFVVPSEADDVVRMWREGLQSTAEFHGLTSWTSVDSKGLVKGHDGENRPWHEVVWEWYDARY